MLAMEREERLSYESLDGLRRRASVVPGRSIERLSSRESRERSASRCRSAYFLCTTANTFCPG